MFYFAAGLYATIQFIICLKDYILNKADPNNSGFYPRNYLMVFSVFYSVL